MTGTYTKGPWKFDMRDDGGYFEIATNDGPLLASCGCCGSPWFTKDAQANALLITAAPELLEGAKALFEAIGSLRQFEREYPNDTTNRWDAKLSAVESAENELKAAISKAEGRS